MPGHRRAVAARRARPASAVAPRDRDLLAEDRAHAELERIERAGHAQPASGAHERPQRRGRARARCRSTVGSASRSNRRRTPATRCTSPSMSGRCTRRRSARSRGLVPHLDHAGRAAELDRAPVDAARRGRRPRRRGSRAARGTSSIARPRERRRGTERAARGRRRRRADRAGGAGRAARCGVNRKTSFITRFIWRTLLNPAAVATCVIGRSVSSSRRRAKWARRERATSLGVAPTCSSNRRRRWRALTPSRAASSSSVASSSAPSAMRAHRAAHELGRVDPARRRVRDRDGSAGTDGSPRPRPRPRTRTAACCGAAARRAARAGSRSRW